MTSGMSRPKCYHTMDAFVKLVVVLVRYSGEPSNTVTKINLLNKVIKDCYHCSCTLIVVMCSIMIFLLLFH